MSWAGSIGMSVSIAASNKNKDVIRYGIIIKRIVKFDLRHDIIKFNFTHPGAEQTNGFSPACNL